jgi:hypothetical protein
MTPFTRSSRKAKLLELLRDRRYHSARELLKAGGYRYGARLNELRGFGYGFSVKRDAEKMNLFWYRLASKPAAV